MIYNAAKFLNDTGLLFEINRQVLHPLGLALSVSIQKDRTVVFGGILDCRHDPEGWIFADEELQDGARKLQAYMGEHGNKALITREKALGFVVQPLDVVPE